MDDATADEHVLPEDEQYARDLQLAYDLHAREERRSRRRHGRNHAQNAEDSPGPFDEGDGFRHGALSADHMLFVACTVNGRQAAMLVDTGASTSAMSMQMVALLELDERINPTYNGNAQGVGSSPILGIVENVSCVIETVEFRSFFLVLEGTMPYCILGLDQMRRFSCIVDVGGSCLVFGGREGVSVPFLSQEIAAGVARNMMSQSTPSIATTSAPPEVAQLGRSSTQPPPSEGRERNRGFPSLSSWRRRGQE